jgi:hypothetical protein
MGTLVTPGCIPQSRRKMTRKSQPSLHGSTHTYILHFGRIPVQMGLASLCPKYATPAAQSIPDRPHKPGVSRYTNPHMGYRQLKSKDSPHSHALSHCRYGHTEPIFFFSFVMFLCISQKPHALHQPEGKEQRRFAVSYNIGIVMVGHAQEPPCIPSVTQGLSSFFHRQNHSADEASENCFGRNRRANTTTRERSATIPSKPRGGRKPVSPSSVQKPRPVSFPCVLPRLSFGEALPDADELFTSIGGSSDHILRSPCQDDQSAQTQGRQRTQADEYREECVSRHPLEYPYVDTIPPSSLVQPPPRRTQATALLETCITQMMATSERRHGGARNMRVFDGGITQPIPLITEGSRSHGGYSLFPSRQRTGNASTPPALIPLPEPEHSEAKARLDSAAVPASETQQAEHFQVKAHPDSRELPASETHQSENPKAKVRLDSADLPAGVNNRVSTLDPLEEDINRDSAAYVPGKKPRPGTNSSDQSNAKAVPADRSQSHDDTSATKDVNPLVVLDQPAIVSPPSLRFRSQPASQPASQNSPPPNSLRTSRNLKCRPVNRSQDSQTSGIVAATNSSSSRGDGSPVVDGASSSSNLATSSPSPPPVSPCDLGRKGK